MTMHCLRAGAGSPPLVFVHGFGCAHEDWRMQVDRFSGTRQVLACDLRGHGRTPGAPEDCTIERYGADVAELLGALDSPAVLVGHSMGCRVVLEANRASSGRVAALALVDGSRMGTGDAAQAEEAMRAAIEFTGYPAFAEALFSQMFFKPSAESAHIIQRAKRLPAKVGMALFPAMVRWDAAQMEYALSAVRAPLLAIQSTTLNADRKRVPLRPGETTPWLELVRRRVPAARIEIVPGVGHFAQIEAGEQVNAFIASLL